ncbi:PaaI family thioesterase [Tsukamurella pulmonis]|uniref:PaaI family thioesterase n=1 Tax=Tsukamurella pulmonis TaxID=47312 RepID=UPI000E099BDD|nr:PaaI family thioesterase [Tsukamurella pulmonis]RDH13669.1 PaaI family thioesterase [Tsukamurella pulmonis]
MKFTSDQILDMVPFARTLGIEFAAISDATVEARMRNRPELSTMGGGLHGGAVMGIADVVGAATTALALDEGDLWTTIESTTYFLNPGKGECVVARGSATKTGNSLAFVQIDLYSDREVHLARTSQVVAIQRRH